MELRATFGNDEIVGGQRTRLQVKREVEAVSKEGLNHAPLEVAVLLRRQTLDLVDVGLSLEIEAGRSEPGRPIEDLLLRHTVGPLHKRNQRDVGGAEAVARRVVDVGVAVGGGTGHPNGSDFERSGRNLRVGQLASEEYQEQESGQSHSTIGQLCSAIRVEHQRYVCSFSLLPLILPLSKVERGRIPRILLFAVVVAFAYLGSHPIRSYAEIRCSGAPSFAHFGEGWDV